VLFLGRISFVKGLDLLIEAFAGAHKSASLTIVGPDDRDGCLEVIRRRKVERVTLPGPLYGREKLEALVDADLLVLPSRYESFGNAAAEAIACGTPVLVSDQCGIAPLVKGRVGIVVPCTVEANRDGLIRLLNDATLRQALQGHCAEVTSELSWDEPVAATELLYETVCATEAG
jgi:glycosyltransferase involved in cell wall biosynthesis